MTSGDKIPSPRELQILALLGEEIHAREIVKLYESTALRTPGSPGSLPYGTLYTLLERMYQRGWVRARDEVRLDWTVRLFVIEPLGQTALLRGRERYRAIAEFGEDLGFEGGEQPC